MYNVKSVDNKKLLKISIKILQSLQESSPYFSDINNCTPEKLLLRPLITDLLNTNRRIK